MLGVCRFGWAEVGWRVVVKQQKRVKDFTGNFSIQFLRSHEENSFLPPWCSTATPALVFIVALEIAGFPLSFSSIFKIIFHNFGARIVILCLLFISVKKGAI